MARHSWPAVCYEGSAGVREAIFSIRDGPRRVLAAVAVGTAIGIALFPLYWAVVTSLRPRDADLGDLWLPGVTFKPTLAARERLLALPGLYLVRMDVRLGAGVRRGTIFSRADSGYGKRRRGQFRRCHDARVGRDRGAGACRAAGTALHGAPSHWERPRDSGEGDGPKISESALACVDTGELNDYRDVRLDQSSGAPLPENHDPPCQSPGSGWHSECEQIARDAACRRV
jgi:ABC-type glycerol-3-phosphate transport system permease component